VSRLLYTPTDENRTLDAAWLMIEGGLPRSPNNGHRIRLGTTGADGKPSWLATFDQHEQAVPRGGVLRLTPPGRLARRIPNGGAVVAEVVAYGVPVIDMPLAAQLQIGAAGLVPSHRVSEPSMRDAVDSLAGHVLAVGAGDQVFSRELVVPSAIDPQQDFDTTDKDITTGGGTQAWDVSITFTKPRWATRGRVILTVTGSIIGLVGTGVGTVEVFDGTTAHNLIPFNTPTSTFVFGTGYSGTILSTTTFTPRGTATTQDHRVSNQLIYGTCDWS
jgi:hypothetical protein